MTIEPGDIEPSFDDEQRVEQTAGAKLQSERLRLGISEQIVADKLHITMHYVRAIESDNYEKLPGKVFAKGYIKSYALLLKLDVDDIVRHYDEFCEIINEEEEKQGRLVAAKRNKDRLLPLLLLVIFVLIVGIVGFWVFSRFFSSADPVDSAMVGSIERDFGADLRLDDLPPEFDDTPQFTAALVADPGPVLDLVEFQEKRIIEVYNVGSDLLQISFAGKCWVEVIDAGSTNIYREIQESGDVVRITGTAPFRILLGDAPFVTVELNGQLIDVNGNIRIDNSARLVVGI